MVLGGKLTMVRLTLYSLVTASLLSACVHAAQEKAVTVAGKQIFLDSESCTLKIDNEVLNIGMKPRCYFAIGDSGKDVGIKYYDDIGAHVLLIVGTSAPKNPDYPLTLKRNDCGEQLQALIIKGKTSRLSKVASDTLICAGVGADEKTYYILSHP